MDTSVGRAVEDSAATEGAVSEKYCRSCNYAMRERVFECFTDGTKERYLVGERTCSKCFRTEFFTPGEPEPEPSYIQAFVPDYRPEEEPLDVATTWHHLNSWDRKKMKTTQNQVRELEMRRLGKKHPSEPGRRAQLFIELVVPPTMSPEDIQKWLVVVFENGSHRGPMVDMKNVEIRLATKTIAEQVRRVCNNCLGELKETWTAADRVFEHVSKSDEKKCGQKLIPIVCTTAKPPQP